MKADIQVLQAKLRDFGLNPQEWILETQNRIGNLFQMSIRCKEDRGLILQGWAEHGAWLVVSFHG